MQNSDFQEVYIDRIDIKSALTGSSFTDPPLLQELGIDFSQIKSECLLVIKPRQIENCDITGPIFIVFLYAISLLLNGKVHFGYVYFLTLVSNFFMYFLLNAMKNTQKNVDIFRIFSTLGYCFTPVVLFSFFHSVCKYFYFVGFLCALWSSTAASLIFCKYLDMEESVLIIGYPILLIYTCYVFLVVF